MIRLATVDPYLNFGGRCEEALAFYTKAIEAEVLFSMRFGEVPDGAPECQVPAGWEKKVMHSLFRVGASKIMASDGCGGVETPGGFSLSLSVHSVKNAEKWFHALSEGGEITSPLDKTFWSPCFGMVRDKFGIHWMISVFPDSHSAAPESGNHPSAAINS